MQKKITIYLLLFTLPVYFGCSTLTPISKDYWSQLKDSKYKTDEIFISTKFGDDYILSWESISIKKDSLFGEGIMLSENLSIPFEGVILLQEIYKIEIEEFDYVVLIWIISFFGLIALILLLTASSNLRGAVAAGFN